MPALFALPLDFAHWQLWIAPLIGVTFGGIALFVGGTVLRRRRKPAPSAEQTGPAKPAEAAVEQDPFAYGSSKEKRVAVRRTGQPIRVLISDADAIAVPVEGFVVDRSVGGLCLSVETAISEGTILSVRSVVDGDASQWIRVEVKRCENKEGRWELGCKFVRTPSYSTLLAFG
jgi:hypothetical protein